NESRKGKASNFQSEQGYSKSANVPHYGRIGWKRVVEKSFGHASHYLMAVNSSKLKGESHNRQ
ncbi:MAG: hypothetical protein J7K15_12765, partial [Deltaproteobacteria bacterium]|nr:hypothetical protein [Deltaproteobacteria bacterium]